ncbi:MAG TPA: FHA domain-containing protein [Acidimicrobiales bacterium]|nr:FHA domain-containing protein [Acidimicrobiales bacterium]
MPDPVLTLLKYVFLALLYLFFLRVLRAVWIELREPKPAPLPAPVPPTAPQQAVPASNPGPERLVVAEPKEHKGTEFAVSDEMTVGRAAGCGVPLPDDTFVSQLHARVFRRDGDIFVEDLGSTNGTYLNDKKVTSAVPLRKGDKVRFGRTTLELRK